MQDDESEFLEGFVEPEADLLRKTEAKKALKAAVTDRKELKRKLEEIDDSDFDDNSEDDNSEDDDSEEGDSEEEDSEEEDAVEALPNDGPELAKILNAEAAIFINGTLKTTEKAGYSLRAREGLKKPEDLYWERFGKREAERLDLKEAKKAIVDDLKDLKKEYPDRIDIEWPKVTTKTSLETLEREHARIMELLGIEYDDGSEEEEDEEDEEDESEGRWLTTN